MRVMIAGERRVDRDAVRQGVLGVGLECAAVDVGPVEEVRGRAATPPAPGLVLAVVGGAASLAAVGELTRAGLPVYAIGPVADAQLLHGALAAGAKGYLNGADLRAELLRVVEGLRQAGEIALRRGALVGVTAAQPGVGVTTAAAGLAFALGRAGAGKVALAEVAPATPLLALTLNLNPPHSVGELYQWPDRLDGAMVRGTAVAHPAGVDLLAYPPETQQPEPPSREAVSAVEPLLRALYDWTVLDLGAAAGPTDLLRRCDAVVLVAAADVAGVRLARRFARDLGEADFPADRLKVVVNRYDQSGQVAWRQVQTTLALPVADWLPDATGAVNRSRNLGQPVADVSGGGRLARRFRSLAAALRSAAAAPAAVAP